GGFGNRYARGWGTADGEVLTTAPCVNGNHTVVGDGMACCRHGRPADPTRGRPAQPFLPLPRSTKGPDGNSVNALRGYLDMVSRVLVDRRPEAVANVFDADWRPPWRGGPLPRPKRHRGP